MITTILTKGSLGLYRLQQNKPWFDEECLQFLDQRKHAKRQWLQNPKQPVVNNLNSIRREDSRHFKKKMWNT